MRKEGALDWRELYEILSYMVKQPFYCGEDQKKYYQETKQKADRDKMNPVYKRFFDIEDSVKANRLETRERAIANGWDTKIDENGHVVSDDAAQKNTTSTIISGKWKKAVLRPDTSGIWMQSAL